MTGQVIPHLISEFQQNNLLNLKTLFTLEIGKIRIGEMKILLHD